MPLSDLAIVVIGILPGVQPMSRGRNRLFRISDSSKSMEVAASVVALLKEPFAASTATSR
jgi:hypothetical protein